MRYALLLLIFTTFLLSNQSYHKELKNDRIYHLESYDFLSYIGWIAVNHTPDLIDIVSDEKSNSLFVKANASSGLGLVEVVLLNENRSIWLSYALQDEHNYFSLNLEDKDPLVSATVSALEEGASVQIGKKKLVYNGKKSGSFLVGYLTKSGNYKTKRFVVTKSAIVGFDAFVTLFDTATIFIDASAQSSVDIVFAGEKGVATLRGNQIYFEADKGQFGRDKIVLSIDGQMVSINLNIAKRYSNILPIEGSFRSDGSEKESFYKEQNGFRHQIDSFYSGRVVLNMQNSSRKTTIRSNVPIDLNATKDYGYKIALSSGEIRVADDGTVYGTVFDNVFLIDSNEQNITILSDDTVLLSNAKGRVLIDKLAIRVFTDKLFLATLPSSSEVIVDDQGANLTLKKLDNNLILPIGIVYGEDDSDLHRADPKANSVIKTAWSGEIELIQGEKTYRSHGVKAKEFRLQNSDSWQRFISNGSSVDLKAFEKIIEVQKPTNPTSWAISDKQIDGTLNSLFRIDSSKLYYAKGAKDGNISLFEQTVIWQKKSSFVGVGEFVSSEIALDEGCKLLDLTGEIVGFYEKNSPYILECN